MLTVCSVSLDSIRLLTTTTDFVSLFCFTGYVVCIRTVLLVGFESGVLVSAQI